MPTFSQMLDDIGSPSDKATAAALGVTTKTVRTWKKTDAPRSVLLAVFWVTRWGLSRTNAEVYDLSQLHYTTALVRRLEIERLNQAIEQLQKIGQFGSANDPLNQHSRPARAIGLTEPVPSQPAQALRANTPPPSVAHR